MAGFGGIGFCCCGPPAPPECAYFDDFSFLRDYEFDVLASGQLSSSPLLAVGDGPTEVGGPWSLSTDDPNNPGPGTEARRKTGYGDWGWHASTLHANAKFQACEIKCLSEGGIPINCGDDAWWELWNEAVLARLHLRKVPFLGFPATCCTPEDNWVIGSNGGWAGFDTGHCLKTFTASDIYISEPPVEASVFLYGDPDYGQQITDAGCGPPKGGYGEWGLHVGAPGAADVNLTPTDNTIRVCLSTDWDVGPHVRGDGKATGYLRIWDGNGDFTEVTLGVNHAALTTAAVYVSVKLTYEANGLWAIDAEVGGQTTQLTNVPLNFEGLPGSTPTVLPIGMYAIGGGEFSGFCVNGIDTSDECALCGEAGLGSAWEIDTLIDEGFYSSSIGDCASPTSCGDDPWGGTQVLGLVDHVSHTCYWESCHNGYACWDDGTTKWCLPGGKAITLSTEGGVLLLRYLYYVTTSGDVVTSQTLAEYEAPIEQVCGPATFAKTIDNTSGNYFPATVTATRVFSPQGCTDDDLPSTECCPGDFEGIPTTLKATIENYTSTDCAGFASITDLEYNGYGTWIGTLTIDRRDWRVAPECRDRLGWGEHCEYAEVPVYLSCRRSVTDDGPSSIVGWSLQVGGAGTLFDYSAQCNPFQASFGPYTNVTFGCVAVANDFINLEIDITE